MTRMPTSIALPLWLTAIPCIIRTPSCCSTTRPRAHIFSLVAVVLVLLALLGAANGDEEDLVIKYNFETQNGTKQDSGNKGDYIYIEVMSDDTQVVLGEASQLELCEPKWNTEEHPLKNRNGTSSWKICCLTQEFYYYIRSYNGDSCKFGVVHTRNDSEDNMSNNINNNNDNDDGVGKPHSKMKSPAPEDDKNKCQEGFIKKDGECYQSSFQLIIIIVHSVLGGVIVGGLVVWFVVWRRRQWRRSQAIINEENSTPKTPAITVASITTPEVAALPPASAPTDMMIAGLGGFESSCTTGEIIERPPCLDQAETSLSSPVSDDSTPATAPSAPHLSELVKMDTGDPPTYEEATKPL